MSSREVPSGRILQLFHKHGGRCVYCQRHVHLVGDAKHPLFATIDHKTPRVKGGSNYLSNLTLACVQCNTVKDDLNYEEFTALFDALGDIDAVTNALQGPYMAKAWRTKSRA